MNTPQPAAQLSEFHAEAADERDSMVSKAHDSRENLRVPMLWKETSQRQLTWDSTYDPLWSPLSKMHWANCSLFKSSSSQLSMAQTHCMDTKNHSAHVGHESSKKCRRIGNQQSWYILKSLIQRSKRRGHHSAGLAATLTPSTNVVSSLASEKSSFGCLWCGYHWHKI